MKEFLSSRLQTGLRRLSKNKTVAVQAAGESDHSWLAKINASPYWTRRRWIHLFGWSGAAGIGLLIVCLAFYLAAIRPAQFSLAAARQSAIELQQHGRHNAARNSQSPAEQLAVFYRTFPNEKELLPWIEKIFIMAHDQGISLDRGEYKVTSDKVGKLMRFQMSLPLKGEYPQIRKYLDSLLVEIPIVSLEHLQLERQKVGDPTLEANIRLALYMGQKP